MRSGDVRTSVVHAGRLQAIAPGQGRSWDPFVIHRVEVLHW